MSTGAHIVTTTLSYTEDPADNVRARCILSCVAGSTVSCALVKKEGYRYNPPFLMRAASGEPMRLLGIPPR